MVIVKLPTVPAQLFRVGVTVMVPVKLLPPVLLGAVHPGMFPVPLAGNPMAVLLLLQVKTEPAGTEEKVMVPI